MIRTVIIDDEAGNIDLLTGLLRTYAPQLEIAGTAGSVQEGYALVLRERPALLLLDVQMGDGTGFDLLQLLGALSLKVIFITAHQQFAIDAFHFSAIDYLLKPIVPAQLLAAVRKAEEALSNEELRLKLDTLLGNLGETSQRKKKLVLKTLDRVYAVTSPEIVRFQSDGSYTTVYLADGKKIVVSRLLKEFEELLGNSGFLRVHQSHLVNLDFVFYFEKSDSILVMKDQSAIPVSSRRKDQLLRAI